MEHGVYGYDLEESGFLCVLDKIPAEIEYVVELRGERSLVWLAYIVTVLC